MIGISGLGRATPVRGGTTVARAGAGRFAMPAAPAAPAAPNGPASAIGLIGLQEDDRPYARDRAARRGGEHVLAALDRLRQTALDGAGHSAGHDALAALDHAIGQMAEPHDPVLRGLIAAIRLRARVERARAHHSRCPPM